MKFHSISHVNVKFLKRDREEGVCGTSHTFFSRESKENKHFSKAFPADVISKHSIISKTDGALKALTFSSQESNWIP